MTASLEIDELWAAPPASPPPRRSRLLVVVAIAAGIFAVVGTAAVVIDQAMRVAVPDVVGMSVSEATDALEGVGLEAAASTADGFCGIVSNAHLCLVTAQVDAAGDRLHAGSEVALSAVPATVTVPGVVGSTVADALAALQGAGFVVDLGDRELLTIDGASGWRVAAQSLREGATPLAGTTIELRVHRPRMPAPDVVGSTVAEAAASLEEAGFTVAYALPDGLSEPPDAWIVTATEPAVVRGELPIGGEVALVWSVRVPAVTGGTGDHALDVLTELGLDADFEAESSSQTAVVTQVPAAGTLAEPGTVIMLTTTAASVVFEVTSNGKSAVITWTEPMTLVQHTDAAAKAPWKTTFAPGTTPDVYALGNIAAQVKGGTSITCRIIVNGAVVVEQSSTGAKASVACN